MPILKHASQIQPAQASQSTASVRTTVHVNLVSLVSTATTTALATGKRATAAVYKDLAATDLEGPVTLKAAVVVSEAEVVLAEDAAVTVAAEETVATVVDVGISTREARDLAPESQSLLLLVNHRCRHHAASSG